MLKHFLITIGLLSFTISMLSQSTLTYRQMAKRNYQEVIPDGTYPSEKMSDKLPMYPGGMQGLLSDIQRKLSYPLGAYSSGVQGTVLVQFVVEKDGTIKDVEILKSVDSELDAEAIRVIKELDIWVPGYIEGKPVCSSYVIPIVFHLQKEILGLEYNLKSARSRITWVGKNNEHFNISKKTASLQKGNDFQQYKVVKYAKDKCIILSQTQHNKEFKQKYNIVYATKDTLILLPEGRDIFALCETSEANQYVFVDKMLTYKFVKLYYEALFSNSVNPKVSLKVILCIDSSKKSLVVVQNVTNNETITDTTPISKKEFETLLKVLASCDVNNIPNDNRMAETKFSYSILEILHNNQIKTFKGFTRLPPIFAEELADFICDYIETRANLIARWGWRIWINRHN